MKTSMRALGKKLLSLALVLVMIVGLLPAISLPTKAAEDTVSTGNDGMLILTLTAINGKGERGNANVGSITASALLSNKDDGTYVEERTARYIEVTISLSKRKIPPQSR